MYEEALSMEFYTDYGLPALAKKKVGLLRHLKKWETLCKFLRELESNRCFDEWNPVLNVDLALSYCKLSRFDEAEKVVLGGLSKSPEGEEAMSLHILLDVVMAKRNILSAIGYLFLEYGEYELTSICFDLELKSMARNTNNGEVSILVQYGVQCDACNAEDFPLKRYIQKKPPDGPGDSFDLCESCFVQHVEQQDDGDKFFYCPSDNPNILNQVTRLVEAGFLVYTTGPDNLRAFDHVGQDL